jgi:hypothetical protein
MAQIPDLISAETKATMACMWLAEVAAGIAAHRVHEIANPLGARCAYREHVLGDLNKVKEALAVIEAALTASAQAEAA